MDIIVQKIVALGVPGLILLFVISSSGVAGGAAIAAGLAALGPGGMLGGIATLGVSVLIADGLSTYGLNAIARAVVQDLKNKGASSAEIRKKIDRAPISAGMKSRIKDYV